jgi:hypothetical protein
MEVDSVPNLDLPNFIKIVDDNNNIIKLSNNEIIEQLKHKVENDLIDCIAFSPKYRDQAKIAFKNISASTIGQIVFFGGLRNYYGYYKHSDDKIFLFEIYQNQINITNIYK